MKTGTKAARQQAAAVAHYEAARYAARCPFGRLFVDGVCVRAASQTEAEVFNATGVLTMNGAPARVQP